MEILSSKRAKTKQTGNPANKFIDSIQDYDFVRAHSEYADVLQCNNSPSSRTPRGHQFPAAFLIRASGLDKVSSIVTL